MIVEGSSTCREPPADDQLAGRADMMFDDACPNNAGGLQKLDLGSP
jgi:hypothetical protein